MQSILRGLLCVCALAGPALADEVSTLVQPPPAPSLPVPPSAEPDRVAAPDAPSGTPTDRLDTKARDAPSAPAIDTAAAAPDRRSPEFATAGALVTTAAGWGLLFHGAFGSGSGAEVLAGLPLILAGPSFGHFYAGEVKHGLVTSGLRTGAFVVGSLGAVVFLSAHSFPGVFIVKQDQGRDSAALTMVGAGLVVVGGISIYDLWDAHRAVDRFNERAARDRASVTVAPLISGGQLGLAVGGRF